MRDFGRGITQPTQAPGLGIGLNLIASMADVFEAYPGFLRGTTVAMRFDLERRPEAPKWLASTDMSSRRSRNAGILSVTTFSR